LHHQTLHHIHQHCNHTDATQMQTNGHTIGFHQGPSCSMTYITEYRGALTLTLALPQSERLPNSTRSLQKRVPNNATNQQIPKNAVGGDQREMTILPICSPASRRRRASGSLSNSNTESTGDGTSPEATRWRARANWEWVAIVDPMISI